MMTDVPSSPDIEDFHPGKNLPDCMMPDGGECCKGYVALYDAYWHLLRRAPAQSSEETAHLIARLRAMPSSLNDACRTMEDAAQEIERLRAGVAKNLRDPNDRRFYEMVQVSRQALDEVLAYLALSRSSEEIERLRKQIEHLTPYVQAFLREEARADKLGAEVDDLRAALALSRPPRGTASVTRPVREYEPGMNPVDDAEFGMKP
jgi:hypothetical protein